MTGFEQFMSGLESGATVMALAVGGVWTYWLFIRNRTDKPSADVSHAVSTVELNPSRRMVRVAVIAKNTSKVLMTVESGVVRVEVVVPLDPEIARVIEGGDDPVPEGKTRVAWPKRWERRFSWETEPRIIEPSEQSEFYFDFFIPDDIAVIDIYSHLRNQAIRNRSIGWNTRTMHQVLEPHQGRAMLLRHHAAGQTGPRPTPPTPAPPPSPPEQGPEHD